MHRLPQSIVVPACALALASCGSGADAPAGDAPRLVPAYNRETGRLEQLTSDRDGDGRIDTWAHMDGPRLRRVEIDRDGDGVPERLEHYETQADADPTAAFGGTVIVTAEQVTGPDRVVTRREWYEGGVLSRVEEDLDADGRIDKWEYYAGGRLARMELDLQKRGFPDRRLTYGVLGVHVEIDPDGDGVFEPAPAVPVGEDASGTRSSR